MAIERSYSGGNSGATTASDPTSKAVERRRQEGREKRGIGHNSPDLDRLLGAFGGASLVYSNMMLTSRYLQEQA